MKDFDQEIAKSVSKKYNFRRFYLLNFERDKKISDREYYLFFIDIITSGIENNSRKGIQMINIWNKKNGEMTFYRSKRHRILAKGSQVI